MSKISVRAAVQDDAELISAVVQRAIRLTNSEDYAPAVIDLICSHFTAEKILARMHERDVFACFIDHRCAGTISFGGNKLHSLFVEPSLQHSGIGARLVAHLERHALSKGVSELYLSSSLTARLFYEWLGYQSVAFEERQDGSTYLMKKSLQA